LRQSHHVIRSNCIFFAKRAEAWLLLGENKKFNKTELASFDGKNGKPAYVGYKGKVYDCSTSDQWLDGDHVGHLAGQDLTEEMDIAPHADDVLLSRMKVVGELV
jgi:predicted heme/steroid binding protein